MIWELNTLLPEDFPDLIHRCHAEGRPVPSAYAAIEHNLDATHIRIWLEQRDKKTDELKDLMRLIAKCPEDTEFPALWTS